MKRIAKIKTMFTKTSVLLLAFVFLASAQAGLFAGVASAAETEAEPKTERSYMQFYSEKGTYTKVKVTLTGPLDNMHKCGALLTGGSYSYLKKLSKTGTTRIGCDPTSGSTQYRVAFYKGQRTADGQEVIIRNNVNVDPGKCTVIHPRGAITVSALKNRCPSGAGQDTIARHAFAMQVCLTRDTCAQTINSVNPRKGVAGSIRVLENPSNDGSPHVSKVFCTGNVKYHYQNSTTGAESAKYSSPLRFKAGGAGADRCEAKIKTQNLRLAANTQYTIIASYNPDDQKRPNIYLNNNPVTTGATTPGAVRTK